MEFVDVDHSNSSVFCNYLQALRAIKKLHAVSLVHEDLHIGNVANLKQQFMTVHEITGISMNTRIGQLLCS